MTRIAVGAFLHEANTFAPIKATYADFEHGGGWPAMSSGRDVPKVMRRINAALAGFGDVRVVVASHKAQLADQSMYRYVGIEPTAQKILVNKSSVHFRADFEPIAAKLLICAAPGAMPADPASPPWRRLRAGIRLRPNGPASTPATKGITG
jgi:microcystin degradation protein MlrC